MLKNHFKAVATAYFNQELFYKTTDPAIMKRILNDVTNTGSTIAIASMEDNNFNTIAKLKATRTKFHLINSDYTPMIQLDLSKQVSPTSYYKYMLPDISL